MSYTLGTAAKATGKSKATISRAIKSGRISAKKTDSGSYAIDPAELHRVFQPTCNDNPQMEQTVTPEETGMLRTENELLRQQLAQVQSTVDDLRKRLDDESKERRTTQGKLTALLTDQRGNGGGFWSRLFGR